MVALASDWADPRLVIAAIGSILAALALARAGLAVRHARRARSHSEALESALAAMSGRLESAGALQLRAARRLKRLEAEHARLVERCNLLESRIDGRSIDQAIDSARRGATVTGLSERFGLSRGEADLVARLHGRPKV